MYDMLNGFRWSVLYPSPVSWLHWGGARRAAGWRNPPSRLWGRSWASCPPTRRARRAEAPLLSRTPSSGSSWRPTSGRCWGRTPGAQPRPGVSLAWGAGKGGSVRLMGKVCNTILSFRLVMLRQHVLNSSANTIIQWGHNVTSLHYQLV